MGLGYLIPLMWACLTIAALIGALCTGFWLSSVNVRKREALKQSFSAKLRQSEQDRDTRIARLTSELDHYRTQTPTLEASLAERSALIVAQESELEARRKSVARITQELEVERQLAVEAQAGKNENVQRAVALEEALTSEQQRRTDLQEELTGAQHSCTELESRLDDLAQENSKLLTRQQRAADELGISRSEAQRQTAAFETIKHELEQRQNDLNSLQEQLTDREQELRALTRTSETAEQKTTEVSDLAKTVENLKQELVNRRGEISSSQDALDSWQHKYDQLLAAQKERDAKLVAVESELRHWQKRHDDLASDVRTDHQADREGDNVHSDRIARLLNENQKLARALKRAQRTARSQKLHSGGRQPHASAAPVQAEWLMSAAPAVPDDLQKIRGIGPVMEKTLNELGVYLYRQLASLRKEDIDWVASHLNTFPGRIERDQWIAQAAELHDRKSGR